MGQNVGFEFVWSVEFFGAAYMGPGEKTEQSASD